MADTPQDLFLAYLPHIEKVATHACRKRGFSPEDTEEFVSLVNEKIWENDYAVLRKFQGKSSLKTYLTVVIERLCLDQLNHLRGKWRPSAEAERLGPLAIQLETMLYRDGIPLDRACQILLTNHHVEASLQELQDLADKIPHRNPLRPRIESDEVLKACPSGTLNPEEEALIKEKRKRCLEIFGFLRAARAKLSPEDDHLITLHSSGLSVAQIARKLGLEQKPLYRRLEKIYAALRQELESRGVRPEEISGFGALEDEEEGDEDEPVH
jgi:RNA polymerase sigma factor (sigma-70 family)